MGVPAWLIREQLVQAGAECETVVDGWPFTSHLRTGVSNQSLTYNSGNQISSSGYSYDGAGNRTADAGITAAYNTAGQMTSSTKAGITTSYGYADTGNNELLREAIPGGDTYSYGRTDQNGLPEIEQITYTHDSTTPTSPTTTPACQSCSPSRPAAPACTSTTAPATPPAWSPTSGRPCARPGRPRSASCR